MTDQNYKDCYFRAQDGLSLYYRDYGNESLAGTPILCLAGLTRHSADFHELALRFSGRHRVLAMDLRGRGNSDYDPDASHYTPATYVNDIGHLLTAANCHQVIVIGTSLGGLLAMAMGAAKPTALRAVVLNDVGPEIDPTGIARIQAYVGKASVPTTMAEAAQAMQEIYGIAFPDLSPEDWMKQAEASYRIGNDGNLSLAYDPAIATTGGDVTKSNLWPYFNSLRSIPLLALRGELSDLLNAKTFVEMQKQNPDMIAVTVKNRGHAPLLDEPDCLLAIDHFIENVEK
jgi:pimeloyl-ACP methyl ester carboxylesterase